MSDDIKELLEYENEMEMRANLRLLEEALSNSNYDDCIVFIETSDRQYEIKSVEVKQQVNVSNKIETVIVIKV